MSVSAKKSSETICLALNHPLRRWIIELLEARGTLSGSELRSLLNISPGRLYYHLENLVRLTEQDENQQYMLSMEGKRACRLLIGSNEGTIKTSAQTTTRTDA
jgi:predicted transcriptional regulator